ncbi:MAG: hypothetical protein KGI54_18545, partial [Pseudomonadota bacterium]|nr:hypothetical protein [Pseudomonadota bacterium]
SPFEFPIWYKGQYVSADNLNTAQTSNSTSLQNLANTLYSPGLFTPSSLTYTFNNSLIVTVGAGNTFFLLDGYGQLGQGLGTVSGTTSTTYNVDFTSQVPSSGSVTAYIVAKVVTIGQNQSVVIGPPIGHPDYNPANAPAVQYLSSQYSLSFTATTTAPDNQTTFEIARTTLTSGQTAITSVSTGNQVLARPNQIVIVYNGTPNGNLAGTAGNSANGTIPDFVWDTSLNTLWVCTTTGTATTAVWARAFASLNGSSSQVFNVANATTSTEAVSLGQAQADFAAINGNSSEGFSVATPLGFGPGYQAINSYWAQQFLAPINGNPSEVFNVANATTSTEAVALGQFEQKTRYTASQSGSISPVAASTTYNVSSATITFPSFSKTGAFRILARLIGAVNGTGTASIRQNFGAKLYDGTNTFIGANWMVYMAAPNDSAGTSDTILTSATYAPNAVVTFTQQITTLGGSTQFSLSGCNMELYVVEA